jgi:predicted HTH domain antitoxin
MTSIKIDETATEIDKKLSAIVRAGCFASKEEALREAMQMLFTFKPPLRTEAAMQRYLDEEITLGRAAELAGVTRWRFRELLTQRGIRITYEARPARELDAGVERIRKKSSPSNR